MKKIDIKTKETYTKDELKRYLGALSENFTSKVEVLGEGLKIVIKKQDQHTEMIGSIMQDVSVLKEDVSILKNDVSILKDDMQIVKKELKKKVDYDEFLSLVQRVNKLEARS